MFIYPSVCEDNTTAKTPVKYDPLNTDKYTINNYVDLGEVNFIESSDVLYLYFRKWMKDGILYQQ